MIALARHSKGYLVVNLRAGAAGGKVTYVHKLVAEAFLGWSDLHVNHKDLNKTNNKLENLEYVTNMENLRHGFSNGAGTGRSKLTRKERDEIRKLRSQGVKLKILAEKFGVRESAISEIYRGVSWGWEK